MKEKKWDVYVYGDVNMDIVIPGVETLPPPGQEKYIEEMETFVGGGAALFTLGIGKLGLKAVFQGEIGGDLYGERILKAFREVGVDSSLLKIKEGKKTGITLCFTGERDRSFLTYRGTNAGIRIEEADIEKIKKSRHVHVTGYLGSENHASYYRFFKAVKEETQASLSFDLGWDDKGEWNKAIYELFPFVDVLFMNEEEALRYSGKKSAKEAAKDFSLHCGKAVIKRGKKGALAAEGEAVYEVPSFSVKAVDTTGAGDAFNAGFVYAYLSGKSVKEALLYGNACGALSVTALGGNTAFPVRESLEAFLREKIQEERV